MKENTKNVCARQEFIKSGQQNKTDSHILYSQTMLFACHLWNIKKSNNNNNNVLSLIYNVRKYILYYFYNKKQQLMRILRITKQYTHKHPEHVGCHIIFCRWRWWFKPTAFYKQYVWKRSTFMVIYAGLYHLSNTMDGENRIILNVGGVRYV